MKALSGYAEWFWLMVKNIKPVENREWSLTRYIKIDELPIRIYLHASKTPAKRGEIEFIIKTLEIPQLMEFQAVNWERYRGHIIGEITVIGEIEKAYPRNVFIPDFSKYESSVWFFGKYGFVVKDGVLYDKPIPYKGQLGFFEVHL